MQKTRMFLAFVCLMASGGLLADTITDDPLHGCSLTSGCTDNGVTTITGTGDFGFSISPGPQTGDLFLEFLIPNNLSHTPSLGSLVGTWTSGNLDTFLGISASPTNPLSAWLGYTQSLDSLATGYKVYQYNAGTKTLQANPNFASGPIFSVSGVPNGSIIAGFLETGGNYIATASSGGLFVNGTTVATPEPGVVGMVGMGLGLLAFARMRRKK